MRHTIELSGFESMLYLVTFLAVFVTIFGVVPQIRRRVEGPEPIFSCRVFALFGYRIFNKSGAFYRVTLYENFFVFVLIGLTKIDYIDIQKLVFSKNSVPKISMLVNGVDIKIYGELGRLEKLHAELNARIHDR